MTSIIFADYFKITLFMTINENNRITLLTLILNEHISPHE